MTSVDLNTSIQYLKGVGPARAEVLAEIGIESVEDLLYYFPRRHLDRTTVTPISLVKKDSIVTVIGKIEACGERRTRRRKLFQAILSDNTGIINLLWFNGINYVRKSFKPGDRLAVHGKIEFYNGYQIVHPEYDILNDEDDPLNTGSIIPLYPLSQQLKQVRLDNRQFRMMVRTVLKQVDAIPDLFSPSFIKRNNHTALSVALKAIHFAEDADELLNAIRRLKFDEHFFLQLLMALRKEAVIRTPTRALTKTGPYVKQIYDSLDFELTNAQKKVLKEIREDLARPTVMNRLLQGDVGSGKTIVAVLAAAIAAGNGVQVAIMAPTEILAHQHYESIGPLVAQAKLTCALLVGETAPKEREKLLKALAAGRIQIIIGTHALIQKDVVFRELGLVIVDEQHRFGVLQRGDLIAKGMNPHLLAMTATPIPRTLAITYHGDMDLSVINELPKNRRPVVTTKVDPERLPRIYQFMQDEIKKGRQCMIVYPLVEESEKSDLAAAVEAHQTLSERIFPELSVGLIHGRLRKKEKDAVMDAFAANNIQILISTTVIEVGIDIPNATVMLIEHADRFGLTQLHQLRGRVGRGSEKSHCILVQRNYTELSQKRLHIMEQTQDGFLISDEDLKLRGPGDFFGIRQSGFLKYKIANLVTDGPIIREARQAAFALIVKDAHLRNPENANIRRRFLKDYQHMLELVNIT